MAAQRNTSSSGRRFYIWGRGERYWSVTTILKALPKDALKWWAAKTVAEFAVDRSKTWFTMDRDEAIDWLKREPLRYTSDRADFGSAVHAAAESYVLGKPMRGDFGDDERKAIGHFLAFVDALKPRFLQTEASVFNRTQKYAGTLDAIVEIEHELLLALAGGNPHLIPWHLREGRTSYTLLADWKTGGDIEEGKGVYPEVALQLSAYANAEFVGAPNGSEVKLPELDGAFVLHVQAAGWRIVPVDALKPEVFKSFLYVREVFRWLEVISKDVLGTPLEPVADDSRLETPSSSAPAAAEPTDPDPPRRRRAAS